MAIRHERESMRVAAYARASTSRQKEKGLSVSAQLRAIRGYAKHNDWELVDEFIDDGYSGRDRDRPELKRLIAAVRSNRIDAVVVWKLDRLARDTLISAAIRQECASHSVRLVSIHEQTGDSPQEKLVARIFEGLAEFYSDNLSQDIKRGQREVARRGFYPFSQAPIGYRRVATRDGKSKRFMLVPDETYGPTLSAVFASYANGKTVPQIVKELNQRGVAAGSAPRWTQKRLYYLLRNQAYCGHVVIGPRNSDPSSREVVMHSHEALVSEETFGRVQAILDARGSDHAIARLESSPYLLSGLLRCGLCGYHMVGTSAKSGRYSYYTCQQYYQQGKESCSGVRISQSKLESFVMAKTRDLILDEANLQLLVTLVNEQLVQADADEREAVAQMEGHLSALRRRLQRNYEALESGLLDLDELAPRIRELREDIRQSERERDELEAKLADRTMTAVNLEAVIPYAQKLRETLQIGAFKERKSFLAGLIACIRVSREEIVIEYRLPLPEERTEELGSPVLQSVVSGGGGGS